MGPVAEQLLSWTVVGVVVPVLVGIGVGVMSMAPPDFGIAKACFTASAIVLLLKVSIWLTDIAIPRPQRLLFACLLFALIGASWVESWQWVSRRQTFVPEPGTIQPDLVARWGDVAQDVMIKLQTTRAEPFNPPINIKVDLKQFSESRRNYIATPLAPSSCPDYVFTEPMFPEFWYDLAVIQGIGGQAWTPKCVGSTSGRLISPDKWRLDIRLTDSSGQKADSQLCFEISPQHELSVKEKC
jgi:hypothetical protein